MATAQKDTKVRNSTEPATLVGQVVSAITGKPLQTVRVELRKGRIGAMTDSTGRFRIPSTAPGPDTVDVTNVGFRTETLTLDLQGGATTEVVFLLSPAAVRLADIVVRVKKAGPSGRLTGFERRRRRGLGYFITPEMVEKRHAQQPTDLLRMVPGLDVGRSVLGRSTVRLSRSSADCDPSIYLDGEPAHDLNIDDLNQNDILAIEVYRGASEYPLEFRFQRARCGLIVIWTKAKQTQVMSP